MESFSKYCLWLVIGVTSGGKIDCWRGKKCPPWTFHALHQPEWGLSSPPISFWASSSKMLFFAARLHRRYDFTTFDSCIVADHVATKLIAADCWVDFAWSKSGEHSAAGPTSSPARFDVTRLTSLSTNQSRSHDQPANRRAGLGSHTGEWARGEDRRAAPKFHHQGGRWWCAGSCTETRCDTGGEERRRLRAALTHQPPKPLGSSALPPARQTVASEKAQRAVRESEPGSICPFVEVLLWQEAAGRENGWCQLQQQQQLVLQSRAEASAIWRHTHTSRIFRNTHARISEVMMINIWMVVDMSLQWWCHSSQFKVGAVWVDVCTSSVKDERK